MPPATLTPDAATLDLKAEALAEINETEKFFDRTLRCFEEADSLFRAAPPCYSVAAHVRHAAQVIDWFREGALHDRWAMNFEEQIAEAHAAPSLEAAKADLALAFSGLREEISTTTAARLSETLPDNPILPGRPRRRVVGAVVDHSAHHRGALAVCARLLGKEPLMPYGDD